MNLGSEVLITDGGSEKFKQQVTAIEFCEQTQSYWISTKDKITGVNIIKDLSGGTLVVDLEGQEALCRVFDKIDIEESKLRDLLRANKLLEPTLKRHYAARILERYRFTQEILRGILQRYITMQNYGTLKFQDELTVLRLDQLQDILQLLQKTEVDHS